MTVCLKVRSPTHSSEQVLHVSELTTIGDLRQILRIQLKLSSSAEQIDIEYDFPPSRIVSADAFATLKSLNIVSGNMSVSVNTSKKPTAANASASANANANANANAGSGGSLAPKPNIARVHSSDAEIARLMQMSDDADPGSANHAAANKTINQMLNGMQNGNNGGGGGGGGGNAHAINRIANMHNANAIASAANDANDSDLAMALALSKSEEDAPQAVQRQTTEDLYIEQAMALSMESLSVNNSGENNDNDNNNNSNNNSDNNDHNNNNNNNNSDSNAPPSKVKANKIIKKLIASDNSCLFNAVSFVCDTGELSKSGELREMIANIVISDSVKYNEGLLGKPNWSYAEYVMSKNTWGGSVELRILSEVFKTEIRAIDIVTLQMHKFGEDSNFKQCAYVIYNGVHYDALVLEKNDSANGNRIQYKFETSDENVCAMVFRVAIQLNADKVYTDVYNFKLQCGVCKIKIRGQKEANDHAIQTGHCQFTELK